MAHYSESVIEQIKSRLTISEVVSSYVKLNRKGDRHWGLCPFHHEKTPSFTVLDSGGFFKCFGCGKGGSMFDFIMEIEHIDFPQAVEILAKKAGVELKEESPQEKAKISEERALGELYNRIEDYYHRFLLQSAEAKDAREYIAKRKISNEITERFMLGFASDNPSSLYNLLSPNYSEEFLRKSGLFSKEYKTFPFFKNRVLFPIRNYKGDCVGFSGRDLSNDPKAAKYKNSSESPIYSKKNILFGFYESLPSIKEKQEIILCEGNFDVISLHQSGISNACAPLGTSFTDQQAALIRRYCSKIKILFDSDSAGQKATGRALLICQKNDIENFVILPFENAKDVSQLLEEQGEEAVCKNCSNVVQGFSYLVSLALKMYDIRQPKGKSAVFKEVKPYLDATSSEIERQAYIKYLSDKLRISEESVLSEYKKQRTSEADTAEAEIPTKTKKHTLSVSPDLNTMLLIINNRHLFNDFRKQIKINNLDDEKAQKLYTILEDAERESIGTNDIILQMIDDEDLKNIVVSSFVDDLHKPQNPEEALKDAITQKKLRMLEQKRLNVMHMISAASFENLSKEEFLELLETKSGLDREIEEYRNAGTEDN